MCRGGSWKTLLGWHGRRADESEPARRCSQCFFGGRLTSAQDGDEVPYLLVDLLRGGHGLGDLLPQQDAEPLTQPVDGHIDGAQADPAFGGESFTGDPGTAIGEKSLQILKLFLLFGDGIFPAQVEHGSFEDGEGPATLEIVFGRLMVGGFVRIA